MVRKRSLSEEEKRLWKHVTRNDVPLKKDADAPVVSHIEKHRNTDMRTNTVSRRDFIVDREKNNHNTEKSNNYAGIDRNTAERFRLGNMPIDARLDLHGMTRLSAHNALVFFIKQQIQCKSRCLLVITGKGNGVLRESLPRWLEASEHRKNILAFSVAQSKHGGTGAYYILLRRIRHTNGQ